MKRNNKPFADTDDNKYTHDKRVLSGSFD